MEHPQHIWLARIALSALALPALLGGCAALAGEVSEAATEAQIENLQEPAQQRALEDIASDPEIQAAASEFSQAVARGMVAGITEALAGGRGELQASVEGAVKDLQPELDAMVAGVARSAVRGMMSAAAEGIERDLAPAMKRAWPDNLAAALFEPLGSEEVQETVAELTQTITYNAVVGTDKGIQEVDRRQEAGVSEGPLAWFGVPLTVGWAALVTFASGLGIALVVMVVVLARGRAERRRLEADTRRREELMISMLQAMVTRDMNEEQRERFLRDFHSELSAAH